VARAHVGGLATEAGHLTTRRYAPRRDGVAGGGTMGPQVSIDVHELDGQALEGPDPDGGGEAATGSLAIAADRAVTSVRAATARRRQHRAVDVLFAGTPTATPADDDPPPARTMQVRRSLVLSSLQVGQDGAEAVVSATLDGDAGTVTGTARAVASRTAVLRAVATAVLHAVRDATDGVVRGELVSVEVGTGTPAVATAVVELVGARGRTRCVVGAAVVGDAPHQAVARATLDAVDRSLPQLAGS
jgi:hypothetical protein